MNATRAPASAPQLHDTIAAIPDDQRNPDCPDEINQRKEDRVVEDRVEVGLAIVAIDYIKLVQRLRLSIEDLNCLRAGKMFLQKCIDARNSRPDHVVTAPRTFAKPGSGREKQRHS